MLCIINHIIMFSYYRCEHLGEHPYLNWFIIFHLSLAQRRHSGCDKCFHPFPRSSSAICILISGRIIPRNITFTSIIYRRCPCFFDSTLVGITIMYTDDRLGVTVGTTITIAIRRFFSSARYVQSLSCRFTITCLTYYINISPTAEIISVVIKERPTSVRHVIICCYRRSDIFTDHCGKNVVHTCAIVPRANF